jgi:biotin operon repressor
MPKKAIADIQGTTDRRIDALLSLLAENSTIVISGAKIAREIGVTRQQVWRWIEKLRALGVRVKGHPHTGLSHRAHAGHSGSADAEPSAVWHTVRPAHPPLFQNRLHQ